MDKSKVHYKGSDLIIKALSLFKKSYPKFNVKIISINNGDDFEEFNRSLCTSVGSKKVLKINELNHKLLFNLLSLNKVVVLDQFSKPNANTLGGLARESIAIGAPIISITNTNTPEFVEVYGPGCPLLVASTAEQISNHLNKIMVETKDFRKERQESSAKWAKKNLDVKNISEKYMSHFKLLKT